MESKFFKNIMPPYTKQTKKKKNVVSDLLIKSTYCSTTPKYSLKEI